MSFKVCFVITNGIIRKKFLWISRRKSGFYIAFATPGGIHQSYHQDGKSHMKVGKSEKVSDLANRPPLDSIVDAHFVTSGGFLINDDALDLLQLPEFKDEQIDRVIYLDNRLLKGVSFQIWLVEPWKQAQVPLIMDKRAHMHLFTHTQPWLAIVLYDD
jgi:hypothetical protein